MAFPELETNRDEVLPSVQTVNCKPRVGDRNRGGWVPVFQDGVGA